MVVRTDDRVFGRIGNISVHESDGFEPNGGSNGELTGIGPFIVDDE